MHNVKAINNASVFYIQTVGFNTEWFDFNLAAYCRVFFNDIGFFDEIFFPLYYDDLDFCLRLRKKGYRLFLIPYAKIYHKISLSVGGRNSPQERFLMARNSGYYFRKHLKTWQLPFIVIYRLSSAILWTIRLLKQRNYEAVQYHWKGLVAGWIQKMPRK